MPNYPDDFARLLWRIRSDPARLRSVLLIGAAVLLGVILAATAWYTVQPHERAVVVRLGRYHQTVDSGLHFKLPFGIDRVTKLPVKNQLKEEFGFRSTQLGVRTGYSRAEYDEESLMLTGDLNVADVEWVTQYRIVNPRDYLFKVRNLQTTFRDMNEAVMREVVGDHSINEILTTGRTAIESLAREELQSRITQYEMGITIDQVILQDVNPPEPVKPAFNEVNQAQQEREKLINQAQQEYNKAVPRAAGDAAKVVEEARGYAVERVNRAQGETDRFVALYKEYQQAPEVTRDRLYLETMDEILGGVGRKIIIDEQASGVLPFLNLTPDKQP